MIRASVVQTKNNLSALLKQVKQGETVLVTEHDRPIAQIVPVSQADEGARLSELAKQGLIRLPKGPPLTIDEIQPVQLEKGGYAGAVDALSEERRTGR